MKLRPAVSIAAALAAVSVVAAGSASAWVFAPAHGSSPTRNYVSHSVIDPNNTNTGCDSPRFNSVQVAVDEAPAGGTVYLCGATAFEEQVFLGKSVTVTGDPGASIASPSADKFKDVSSGRFPAQFQRDGLFAPQAIVVVTGATTNATIKGIDVRGPLPGNGGCKNREYGVLALEGSLNLTQASVTNAQDADPSLNGCQFGVGVQVGSTKWPTADWTLSRVENFNADAEIEQTTVRGYAKNGIVIDGSGGYGDIHDNTVIGFGLTSVVAQNGIEIVRGATGEVYNNDISANQYIGTGEASSTGVLLYGGCGDPLVTGVKVHDNKADNNDIGISMNNYGPDCVAATTTPTKNKAYHNEISNSALTNVSGFGGGRGYQAGIADVGNRDSITNNEISGAGYVATDTPAYFVKPIDKAPAPKSNFWQK